MLVDDWSLHQMASLSLLSASSRPRAEIGSTGDRVLVRNFESAKVVSGGAVDSPSWFVDQPAEQESDPFVWSVLWKRP